MSPATTSRRNSLAVRTTILEAAERVFADRGYSGATSRELARVAGVSESVMYRHFGSKGGLFAEAVLAPFLRFLDNFSEVSARYLRQPLPAETMMRLFLSELIDQLTVHRSALRMFLAASEDIDQETKLRFHATLDDVFVRLSEVVEAEKGIRNRPVRPLGTAMDVRAAIGMVLSLVVLDDWFLPAGPNRPSRDDLVDHLSAILL